VVYSLSDIIGGCAKLPAYLRELEELNLRLCSLAEPAFDFPADEGSQLPAWIAVLEAAEKARQRASRLRKRSRSNGKGGRPRKPVNVNQARSLLAQGWSVREAARRMGVGDGTLRRALAASTNAPELRQNSNTPPPGNDPQGTSEALR